MPKIWAIGDPLIAEDLNKTDPETDGRLTQAEFNILQLYFENFFAAQVTPFQGLIFDGFSDTSKADVDATTLFEAASSGQPIIKVP